MEDLLNHAKDLQDLADDMFKLEFVATYPAVQVTWKAARGLVEAKLKVVREEIAHREREMEKQEEKYNDGSEY